MTGNTFSANHTHALTISSVFLLFQSNRTSKKPKLDFVEKLLLADLDMSEDLARFSAYNSLYLSLFSHIGSERQSDGSYKRQRMTYDTLGPSRKKRRYLAPKYGVRFLGPDSRPQPAASALPKETGLPGAGMSANGSGVPLKYAPGNNQTRRSGPSTTDPPFPLRKPMDFKVPQASTPAKSKFVESQPSHIVDLT